MENHKKILVKETIDETEQSYIDQVDLSQIVDLPQTSNLNGKTNILVNFGDTVQSKCEKRCVTQNKSTLQDGQNEIEQDSQEIEINGDIDENTEDNDDQDYSDKSEILNRIVTIKKSAQKVQKRILGKILNRVNNPILFSIESKLNPLTLEDPNSWQINPCVSATKGTVSFHKTKRPTESKKLVFLSEKVLEEVAQQRETNGTKITLRILENYRNKYTNMDFKNVQRRVYDALNVLGALGIINKDGNKIHYKGILKKDSNLINVSKSVLNQDSIKFINQNVYPDNKNDKANNILKITEKTQNHNSQQIFTKKEELKKLHEQIEQRKEEVSNAIQLISEQVIQQTSIKKLIQRNYRNMNKKEGEQGQNSGEMQRTRRSSNSQEGNQNNKKDQIQDKNVMIPFVGLKIHESNKLLVQINQENDVFSAFGEADQIECFTESDMMKTLGLSCTSLTELREFIKPAHLKFVCDTLGVQQEELHCKINGIRERIQKKGHGLINKNADGSGKQSGASIQSLSFPISQNSIEKKQKEVIKQENYQFTAKSVSALNSSSVLNFSQNSAKQQVNSKKEASEFIESFDANQFEVSKVNVDKNQLNSQSYVPSSEKEQDESDENNSVDDIVKFKRQNKFYQKYSKRIKKQENKPEPKTVNIGYFGSSCIGQHVNVNESNHNQTHDKSNQQSNSQKIQKGNKFQKTDLNVNGIQQIPLTPPGIPIGLNQFNSVSNYLQQPRFNNNRWNNNEYLNHFYSNKQVSPNNLFNMYQN